MIKWWWGRRFPWIKQMREVTSFCNPFSCNLCYMGINPITCGLSKVMPTNGSPSKFWHLPLAHNGHGSTTHFSCHHPLCSYWLIGYATIEHTCQKKKKNFWSTILSLIRKDQHSNILKCLVMPQLIWPHQIKHLQSLSSSTTQSYA